jgi:large subunit ribosomal protein L29
MKITDIRSLSCDELSAKESELREEFFKLRFKHNIRHLENSAQLGLIRKNIARIQTILVEKDQKQFATHK